MQCAHSFRLAALSWLLFLLVSCAPSIVVGPPDSSAGDADGDVDADGDADSDIDADADADTPDDGDLDDSDEPDADRDGEGEFLDTCEACSDHDQCGPSARCIALTDGVRVCTDTCVPDIPSCPRGFDCVHNYMAPDHETCVPIGELCCIDEDADGYGVGVGCLGSDCDDLDIAVNPGADELCNGADDDCSDDIDEDVVDCPPQQCEITGEGRYEESPAADCSESECTEPAAISCELFTCDGGASDGDRCAESCAPTGAEDDALCVVTAHCDDALCELDFEDGEPCDEASDCISEHCSNGFCCADGTCCDDVESCPGYPGVVTTCDNTTTCQGTRGEALCDDHQCTTAAGIADDSACDADIESDTCGFFLSIFCTGEEDQPIPRCPPTCDADEDCDDVAHCDIVCVPDLADGNPCDEDSDCISAHCNNNICCTVGDCCHRPDDCDDYSSEPVCDTMSTCQGTRDAAVCVDYMCGTEEDVDDDSACRGEALDCGLYPSVHCSGAISQTPPLCLTRCTSDAECDDEAHCDLETCIPDLDHGNWCDEASDCISGYCDNHFCCDSGVCCHSDDDCPFDDFGTESICSSPTTCQGERRDPECSDESECEVGDIVGDDSGCEGIESSSCGTYPGIQCTDAEVQPVDQEGLCPDSCVADRDCDLGAHCVDRACVTGGGRGDPCERTADCSGALRCVDGVCCDGACEGDCVACDVAGHLGTCTAIADGEDPDNECGGIDCSSYYWGWREGTCHERSDAPASAVGCNGRGGCQNAATLCPERGMGSPGVECNDTCQAANEGTCVGTTSGRCDYAPPARNEQSCGEGGCEVTVPICERPGRLVECVPGDGRAEECNDLDDDCNGPVDDGLDPDEYEPNGSCGLAYNLGTVFSSGATSLTARPTLYPDSDNADIYAVRLEEHPSTNCMGCGFWGDEDHYAIRVELTVPEGAGSYELCNNLGECNRDYCVTVPAGRSDWVEVWGVGECDPWDLFFDWGIWYIQVRPVGAPGFECSPYTLWVSSQAACV